MSLQPIVLTTGLSGHWAREASFNQLHVVRTRRIDTLARRGDRFLIQFIRQV